MNKMTFALSALALAIAPTFALAGPGGTTCATAEQIFKDGTYSGDTSDPAYTDQVGAMGPLPSPAADAIYYFVSDGQTTGDITVTAAGFNFAIFLLTNCAGAAAPPLQAATGPSAPASFPVGTLTAGTTYYVVVSGNPADASAPEGSFTFTTPNPLPVTLQEFSIL
jgi:hypothetical protein